ncbi:MAG: efflux RND transporter periplasmic adaptor subunit [Deltaproteobacteria bacterium]|nr:efflux RND transporter periplasmic adaptor subunit [Deltaproteobacteria bacterium]
MTRKIIIASLAVVLSAAALYVLYHGRIAGAKHAADPIHGTEAHREKDLTPPVMEVHEAEQDHEPGTHVSLSEEQIRTLGIVVATAGPGRLQNALRLKGEILLDGDRVAHVTPYVSGYVKQISKRIGDPVRKGEVMAVLESRELADAKAAYFAALEKVVLAQTRFVREEKLWKKQISSEEDYLEAKQALAAARIEKRSAKQQLLALGLSMTAVDRLPQQSDTSLTRYEIVSPLKGEVLEKNLTLGEMVESDRVVYRVADMDAVWVRVYVHQKDLSLLKKGMPVRISGDDGMEGADGNLSYISPVVDEETRTATGMVTLHNPGGDWRPGRFVTAGIYSESEEFPVVVSKDAVQTITDQHVVFVPAEEGFEAKAVSLNRSDRKHVEIVSGLSAEDPYVAEGAFELKAAMLSETLGDHAGHGH